MAHILVIQTGGTIASSDKGGVISLGGDNDLFREFKGESFKIISPYKILSENLRENHLELLIKEVLEGLKGDVKGIIILHGSDTLAFTSAMIGLCFSYASVPIVLTAANKPPENPGSNALINLRSAVSVIGSCPGGVYTTYKNQNSPGKCTVYLATRIRSADIFTDDFSDIATPLGYTEKGKFKVENGELFSLISDEALKGKAIEGEITFKNKIGVISPYPGYDYKGFNVDLVAAVLHTTYHSSTAPTEPADNSPLLLIKRLAAEKKSLYLAPVKRDLESLYETTQSLVDFGAVSLGHISVEAALAKLMLAYNLKETSPEEFLKKNRYFETL